MNAREFFFLTSRMREAQSQYFQDRTPEALRRARRLENEIDAEIKRVKAILEANEKR